MEKIPTRKINANHKEPFLTEGFVIRDIQDMLAGKDMVQELHRHDFFFMLVLKKGKGNHEVDFTPYEVCGNTVFFLRPGQVHRLTLQAGSMGYLVQFGADFYYSPDEASNQLLRKASSTNFYQPDTNRFKRILSIFTSISQEYTDKQEGYQSVIKAHLSIFFIELVRQHGRIPLNPASTYRQERLEEFSALLATHVHSHKQVSQYADMMHLSSYQLNAITKSMLGKTCSELIDDYIILESKRYLRATSNPINQIADHLGYEDVSYFIRFFKKHTGYTPEAFRNNFR